MDPADIPVVIVIEILIYKIAIFDVPIHPAHFSKDRDVITKLKIAFHPIFVGARV